MSKKDACKRKRLMNIAIIDERNDAAATGEKIISITECVKQQQYRFSSNNETVGIITPTYAWGLPSIVRDFLYALVLDDTPSYLWFLATYGTSAGQVGRFANEIMQRKGLSFAAYFGVKMPDTWTPIFDLSDPRKVRRINLHAEQEIDFAIERIQSQSADDYMRSKVPTAAAKLFYALEYDAMRKTNHFKVENSCVGCGLCAKNCPVSAIEMRDKIPVWVKDRCVMCLACLHHCPKFAIPYGNRTKRHGQYTNPHVK